MEPQQDILSNNWQIDDEIKIYLHQTAVLAKFIAVLSMLFAVLTTAKTGYRLVNFIMTYGDAYYRTILGNIAGAVLAGTVYFSVSLFTYRFAVNLQKALKTNDQTAFILAWQHFKMAYRIMGIMFIIYLAFMLIAFLF